jgi:hypothetical protein
MDGQLVREDQAWRQTLAGLGLEFDGELAAAA